MQRMDENKVLNHYSGKVLSFGNKMFFKFDFLSNDNIICCKILFIRVAIKFYGKYFLYLQPSSL